jgi:tetratricopeptide (TPR) repeat protein
LKISRQVENFSALYNELLRRAPAFSEAPPLDIPWELRLRPDYMRSSGKGFFALTGLMGFIFVLIIWLSDFSVLQIIGIPDKNLVAFGLAMISLIIAALAVAVSLSDIHGLLSITFALHEIRLHRIWGAPAAWSADAIRAISRKRRERLYRGGTRVDQPLYIEFKDGRQLEFTDGWAGAFGIDLERLQNSLHNLYPVRHNGRELSKEQQEAAAVGSQAVQRGNQLYRNGQFQAAIEAYQQAIEHYQGYRFYNLAIADTLREQQRCEQAVEAYQDLLEFVPDNELGWSGLGQCLLQLEKVDDAVLAFERALSINPDDGTIWFHAAQAYAWLEDHARALASLQRALQLLPELRQRARQDTSLRAYLQQLN